MVPTHQISTQGKPHLKHGTMNMSRDKRVLPHTCTSGNRRCYPDHRLWKTEVQIPASSVTELQRSDLSESSADPQQRTKSSRSFMPVPPLWCNTCTKAPEPGLNPTLLFGSAPLVLPAETNPNQEFVRFQNNLFTRVSSSGSSSVYVVINWHWEDLTISSFNKWFSLHGIVHCYLFKKD